MAEDWDLFAIVRSCQSATNTATTENPPTTTNTIPSSISTCTVKEEEYEAFSFPNIVQPITNEFQELNQLFTSFNPTTNATTTSGPGINPNSPDFAGCIGLQQERQQQQQRNHLPVLAPTTTPSSIWPHFVPEEASTSTSFNRFHDQQLQQPQQHVQQQQNQQQLVQKQEFQVPNAQPQTPRSRKRKSQQEKMVCLVTEDNLSADLWAWRKYGQKPIKGSPYPRNYYRCSSSKGCAARKQVERSNTEAGMFIVTYTGDHTHPRPTHRNSLAGSTRSKSPGIHPPGPLSCQLQPQPNTTTSSSSSSAPAPSPATVSEDPPENDVAEEEEDPDPDPGIESDEDDEDEVNVLPPTQAFLPGLDHFHRG